MYLTSILYFNGGRKPKNSWHSSCFYFSRERAENMLLFIITWTVDKLIWNGPAKWRSERPIAVWPVDVRQPSFSFFFFFFFVRFPRPFRGQSVDCNACTYNVSSIHSQYIVTVWPSQRVNYTYEYNIT